MWVVTDLTRLFTDLVRFETRLFNTVDARLRAEHELPLGQFEFLRYIADRDGCRVQDIAHEMAITVGATSKAVDRLEAAGLCLRRANPQDRRSSLIELAPAGRRLLAEATPTFNSELATWVGSVLPSHALEQLAVSLSMMRQRLESDPRTGRVEPSMPARA